MAEHLKTIIIKDMESTGTTFVSLPPTATPHTRGVHYFRANTGISCLRGAMDQKKDGVKRRKRIVVRPSRFRDGLFELYTYHFPKHWSAACVANRERIKEAQRRAHALEHEHTVEALEWRIRFFNHYFTVCKGGAKPEPGMKPYTRFYQYTFVAIYRQLLHPGVVDQPCESQAQYSPVLRTGEQGIAVEQIESRKQIQLNSRVNGIVETETQTDVAVSEPPTVRAFFVGAKQRRAFQEKAQLVYRHKIDTDPTMTYKLLISPRKQHKYPGRRLQNHGCTMDPRHLSEHLSTAS